jgi:hypothetical protein
LPQCWLFPLLCSGNRRLLHQRIHLLQADAAVRDKPRGKVRPACSLLRIVEGVFRLLSLRLTKVARNLSAACTTFSVDDCARPVFRKASMSINDRKTRPGFV